MAERDTGLTTIFKWPPLKPSVLGLLGKVEPIGMYRRCIAQRIPELTGAQALADGLQHRLSLLFGAELQETGSASVAGALEDEHCISWQELLVMPEETLRSASRLQEQLGPRIVLLPSLSLLLVDQQLRRSVQTVLLVLSRQSRISTD